VTTEASTGVSNGRVGRYVLEDLVVRNDHSQLWRASDPALQRPVGVRLIPLSDERAPAIKEAAKAAAGLHDRRVVQVLDVVETRHHLAVVSEWVRGRPWSEVLRDEDADAKAAAVVAYDVALALQAAHALGVTHGRLRPNSVIISDTNEVRLRGIGVDAALYGVAPGNDARAADLHGVGAILYAGLTERWPDPDPEQDAVDGLPVVGPVAGRLLAPEEIVSDVPTELSGIAAACLLPDVQPRTRRRIPDIDHAVAALGKAVKHTVGTLPEDTDGSGRRGSGTRTDRVIRRVASVVIIGITIAAAILFAGSLRDGPLVPAQDAAPDPTPSVAESGAAAVPPQPLALAASTDFDPQGSDGTENPELVPLATDGNLETAWTTVAYKRSSMNPKTGTGLLLDLGLVRPIRAVDLDFFGAGTDVEIRVSEEQGATAADYELLAGAVAAGPELTVRVPIPVETRYVLVWLTNLPYQEGTYIGGIREVQVRG
jgi:hypothetical protein